MQAKRFDFSSEKSQAIEFLVGKIVVDKPNGLVYTVVVSRELARLQLGIIPLKTKDATNENIRNYHPENYRKVRIRDNPLAETLEPENRTPSESL